MFFKTKENQLNTTHLCLLLVLKRNHWERYGLNGYSLNALAKADEKDFGM